MPQLTKTNYPNAVLDQVVGVDASGNVATAPATSKGLIGTYNFDPRNTLQKWRKAAMKAVNGDAQGLILCIGTSLTAGENATGNHLLSNAASKAIPAQLSDRLAALGVPSGKQGWAGGHGETAWASHDTRIAMGGWTNDGIGTLGSNVLQATSAIADATFTPTVSCDTVRVSFLRNSASFSVNLSGGAALSTITTSSSPTTHGVSSVSLGATGVGAIGVKWVSGSPNVCGMMAYNSAIKQIGVLNAGWYGALASNFTTGTWVATDGIKAWAPDLTIIALSRNDVSGATTVATFKSEIELLIQAAQLSGDVLIVIEPMGNITTGNWTAYTTAQLQLAAQYNCAVLDFTVLWPLYASINDWYVDGIHPFGFGYTSMAQGIGDLLVSAL